VTLGNNYLNMIYGAAAGDVLTNVNNTSRVPATSATEHGLHQRWHGPCQPDTELIIEPSSAGFTNNGTVQANTVSTLDITGGPFTNFNSTTNTLTGGTYNVNGGTLQFDNANIVTNAANIILTGAASQIVSNTNANALATSPPTPRAARSRWAGRSFTTSGPGGNFTNNGTLAIGAGDTFQVSGSLSNSPVPRSPAETYTVAGTLQFGVSGSSLTTNDANLTMAGTGAKLLDLGGNNLLAGFNTNAGGGIFTVAAGAASPRLAISPTPEPWTWSRPARLRWPAT